MTQIWAEPELAFAEHKAHSNICAFFENLSSNGTTYQVHRSAYGVETALEVIVLTETGADSSPSVPSVMLYRALSMPAVTISSQRAPSLLSWQPVKQ